MKSILGSEWPKWVALSALLALGMSAAAQRTAVSTRHVPARVSTGQTPLAGALNGAQHLSLTLSLPLKNEAALDALLADLYNPASPNYRHYLSAEEFAARFSPTQAEFDAAIAWAQSKGFTVTGTSTNRRVLEVDATVAAVNAAFAIQLNEYRDDDAGRVFHAPDREPTTDTAFAFYAISGLSDELPPRPHYRKGNAPVNVSSTTLQSADAVAHIVASGPGNTYLPSDMRAAYYGTGPLTGTGQTVAIFSYDGYIPSDLQVFYNNTGMKATVPVTNVLVNGYNGACFGFNANGSINYNTCDDGEQILDIVQVMGMAPGLSQILFYEGSSSTSVLNKIASDNIAKVISSSWGGGDFGTASDPAFKQMQTQGQSYLNATGDSGQFNSSTYNPPSVDPYITQVGGTDLNTVSAGGAWQSETAWSQSGGGFVSGTAIPSYQQTAGVINAQNGGSTTLRNAPDIAAEANFDNTTVINGVFESGYGGTSFATPRWAGLIALANQQSVANGNGTLGFLNPAIYSTALGANYAANFHDITSGSNPPRSGSGSGFNAVPGYDLVTGWGSPIGAAFIGTFAGSAKPTADFSLAAAPSTLSVAQGASGTSTITVSPLNGFTGSVALAASGLPTGVTASFNPASTTSSSTLTLTAAAGATLGNATITLTGTAGSLTHNATLTLTVTAAPLQLLGNTSFENGAAPWLLTAGVLCTNANCGGEYPHTGSWFAWLDGYGSTHTDTVTQQVVLPTGKTSATLSFYLHVDTAETTTTALNDTLAVQVLTPSGRLLATLSVFSNLNAASGYTLQTCNLTAYLGQTVLLRFLGSENASLATSFLVDDVTLNVQ